MPPKAAVLQAPPSASPPPSANPSTSVNDKEDFLIIQDFMDTLDQIPPELTKVHSDLNELGAVLYSTLMNLEKKLNQLVEWIQDPKIGPEQRFQLLQDIAEEAARYKLGGDDKIRVAGGACDGIMAHQKHISDLLNASTLFNPAPPSPYTQSLTLALPTVSTSRRGQLARAANSPFGGRGYAGTSAAVGEKVGETPTKKKKSRVQQLGREDDEVSSVGGDKRKAPAKKRRPAQRAVSPADSIGSTSAFNSRVEPRTARQLAAAANKAARKAEADDYSDDGGEPSRGKGGVAMQPTPSTDSMMDRPGALGLDVGGHSRESSQIGHGGGNGIRSSANVTPVLAAGTVLERSKTDGGRNRGQKRGRDDPEDEDQSDDDDNGGAEDRPLAKRTTSGKKNGSGNGSGNGNGDNKLEVEDRGTGDEGQKDDEHLYCFCQQVSYGEMIGCDDDDCEIEWYHLACLGLDKTPSGNWICPQCTERRKRNPKSQKRPKPRSRK